MRIVLNLNLYPCEMHVENTRPHCRMTKCCAKKHAEYCTYFMLEMRRSHSQKEENYGKSDGNPYD